MTLSRKVQAVVVAGILATGNLIPAGVALAETVEPTVGYSTDTPGQNGVVSGHQTGTGVTDVTIQYKQTGEDIGGTEDPNNPDGNDDELGDNIAFTVPTAINFVADAQGNLTGPSASAAYIENESMFSIHASAFKTNTATGWTIVDDDATSVTTQNAIDFQFGPETDKVGNADAFDYQTEKTKISAVATDAPYVADWNMAPKAANGIEDRVQLNTSGNIFNVSQDITQQTKVAEIHTYVTAGNATAPQQP